MTRTAFPIKILFLFCIIPFLGYGQRPIKQVFDSLLKTQGQVAEKTKEIESLLKKNAGKDPLVLAEMYYEYSKWNWSQAKNEAKSKEYARKEYTLRKKFNEDTLQPLLRRNLYNLGYLYHHATLPDYQSALAYFDTLISLTPQNDSRLGNAYRECGDIYDALGDFQRALENYQYSETLFKELQRPDLQLKALINISGTYASKGDPLLLDDFLKNNQVITRSFGESLSETQKAMVLFNTAAMYNTTNQYDLAFPPANEALRLFQKNEDSLNTYKSLSLLGILANKKRDFIQSQTMFESTFSYAKNNPLLQSATYNNLGDLQKQQGKWDESFVLYRRALYEILGKHQTASPGLPITYDEIRDSPFKKIIFGYLTDLTNAYLEFWRTTKNKTALTEAAQLITLTDTLADDLFLESKEEISKLSWRQKASTCYLNGVALYYELNDPEKVFYYMEKNKGLLLLENMLSVTARKRANIPVPLIDRENDLLAAIQALQMELVSTPEGALKRKGKDSLFQLKNKFRKFIDSLEEKFPVYFAYKKQWSIIPLEKVQKNLAQRDVVLEYAMGKDHSYVLWMDPKNIMIKKLERSTPDLIDDITAFQSFLEHPLETREELEDFRQQSQNLFKTLIPFPEATSYLKEKRLMMVPDGNLHYIPFEVLTVSKAMPLPQAYLISQTDLLYKYSLSVDAEMLKLPRNPSHQWAAYLPTQFKSNYQNTLLFNQEEQSFLEPYFKGHLYLDEKATKSAFMSSFQESTVMHISTHGGVSEQGPWLAFYDEPLLINDLYFLSNKKEMVVLSACKTSQGELVSGEGVYSITRSFINAGTKSVVSALWNLNEKSSTQIMAQYYKGLQKGKTKSEALKEAKLSYLAAHANTSEASPYYWAAITLTGSDTPLNSSFMGNPGFTILLIGLLVLVLGGWYYKKQHS